MDIEALTDDERKQRLRASALAIRDALGRMSVDAIAIGKELSGAKSLLVKNGDWNDWLETSFKWTPRTATNFLTVYEMSREYELTSKTGKFSDLPIKLSALYLLARSTTPDAVRADLVEMAKAGTTVTYAMAQRKLAEANRTAPAPVAKLFDSPEPQVDDDQLDVYERAREALNELKNALPRSALNDPGQEMLKDIERMLARITDAYWEVLGVPVEGAALPRTDRRDEQAITHARLETR
jgi:hypothetical protein